MNQQLLSEGTLLNADGALCQAGYATRLVKQYDRSAIKAGKLRIKEWDYYLIYNDRYGVALTIDDNSYMGLLSVSLLDFEAAMEHTVSPMFWFPMGKTAFPASSDAGDVQKTVRGAGGAFRIENGQRHLSFHIDRFDGELPFSCDLLLCDPPKDTMVIATPFEKKRTAFYYNQKIIAMRASGTVTVGERTLSFDPSDSFGLLDWGRGVWTYRNTWYWSAAQGVRDGHVLGFNLGYGFGDTSAASENMFFVDGVAHKLDRVSFDIPQKDGKDDFLSPWQFRDNEGRLSLTFTPFLDRKSKTDVLLICSDQHQVFGRFDGTVRLDDGAEVRLERFVGFAEKVRNKW